MAVRPDKPDHSERDRTGGFVLIAAMVILMWLAETIDVVAGNIDDAGIHPRDADGLFGIVASPFLHAGFGHLIGNTIPFLLLGAAIAVGGLLRTAAVVGIVALVGGFGTWLTAPSNTVVIGASGLVFGFATYLVARGAYSRQPWHIVGGLTVLVIYGSTLLVGLVPTPGVSWQGHLFGAVGGVVAARVLHRRRSAPRPGVAFSRG
jgi:membrane associated rhomboid family serine protease